MILSEAKSFVKPLSAVLRLGRSGAATDHSAIFYNVNIQTGLTPIRSISSSSLVFLLTKTLDMAIKEGVPSYRPNCFTGLNWGRNRYIFGEPALTSITPLI